MERQDDDNQVFLLNDSIDALCDPEGDPAEEAQKQLITTADECSQIFDRLNISKDEPVLAVWDANYFRNEMIDGKIVLTKSFVVFYRPDNLKLEPFVMDAYLSRRHRLKWHRRWCVLSNDRLDYYMSADSTEKGPVGSISMSEIVACEPTGHDNGFIVSTERKQHRFQADSQNQLGLWVSSILRAASVAQTTFKIPLVAMTALRKEEDIQLLPGSITIEAQGWQHVFSGFAEPDATLAQLGSAFKAASPEAVEQDGGACLTARALFDDDADSEVVTTDASDESEDEDERHSTSSPGSSHGSGSPRESPREELRKHRIAEKSQKKHGFSEHFNLPEDIVLDTFKCCLVRSVREEGRLFVTNKHLCFRANLFGHKQARIPYSAIRSIKKDSTLWIIPNSITITTKSNKEIVFSNMWKREAAFRLMTSQLEAARSGEEDDEEAAGFFEAHPSFPIVSAPPTGPLRITILTIGSRGDVQPYVAFGLGLEKAGHKVTIATHECFKDFVEDYRLKHFNIGGNPRELMELCVSNGMFTPKFMKEALGKFRGFVSEMIDKCYEACKTDCDAIIACPTTIGSYHIAEKLQKPLFGTFTMPFSRTRAYPNPFANPSTPLGGAYNYMTHVLIETVFWQPARGVINQFRAKHDMPVIPLNSSDPYHEKRLPMLYCFSPSVVPKPPDWGDEIDVSGYWFLDAPSSWRPSEELVNFMKTGEDPLIYVGFGSIVTDDPTKLTRTVADALAASPVRCILVQGWGGKTDIEMPPNVFQLDTVPHDWLFPQVKAVVHHGGAGTTAAGLRFGLPTVIVHFFGDQGFWGSRMHDLGCGMSIGHKSLTADKLASAIKYVVTDKGVRDAAACIGKAIREEDGIGRAVQQFHRYLPWALVPPMLRPVGASDKCHKCSVSMGLLGAHSARHCHACGWAFCSKCCHEEMVLHQFFIEEPKRVCNDCFARLTGSNTGDENADSNPLAFSPRLATPRAVQDAEPLPLAQQKLHRRTASQSK